MVKVVLLLVGFLAMSCGKREGQQGPRGEKGAQGDTRVYERSIIPAAEIDGMDNFELCQTERNYIANAMNEIATVDPSKRWIVGAILQDVLPRRYPIYNLASVDLLAKRVNHLDSFSTDCDFAAKNIKLVMRKFYTKDR